jgi:glyoxylase I family protein
MATALYGPTPLFEVFDMPTSIRFYRDKLGFRIHQTSPSLGPDRFHWAWLRRGDAEVMLNTAYENDNERPAEPEKARVAAHKDTGLFFGCPDVDAMYAELRSRGVEVREPEITSYGMKSINFLDPDGYGICFHWRAES